jgi:uncharacterized membrane protein YdcZ (DUF606 family)
MDPQTGRAGFAAGLFVVVTSLMMLPFQDWDSAPFIITVLTLTVGLVFLGAIIVAVRRSLK